MIELKTIIKNLNIRKGLLFNNYKIRSIRLNKEKYNFFIEFIGHGNKDNLVIDFENYVGSNKIISNSKGDLYKCNINIENISKIQTRLNMKCNCIIEKWF